MFKKVLFIICLLFILIGNHTLAPSEKFNAGSNLSSLYPATIVYAAEEHQHPPKNIKTNDTSSWISLIVPGIAGIILIGGIGSYWLVFRKKQLKKEA